jgi:NADPH:quinone reductase
MKAIQFKTFGSPEVLELVEAPVPKITDDQVLIKVQAAALNPIDAKIREGSSFVCEHLELPSGLGFDVCGTVVECGQNVKDFQQGDEVLGSIGRYDNPSSYSEYCIAKPAEIVHKPKAITFDIAAATTISSLTAWQALHRHGQVKKNERVLIHAGAGGVGHFAVQFAKIAGAYVIVTASKQHHVFLKTLGADEIIDYTEAPFEEQVNNIDLVIDLVGGEVGLQSLKVLKPDGRMVTVPTITRDLVLEKAKEKSVQATGMLAKMNTKDLNAVLDLIVNDKVHVKIAASFPLAKAKEAHEMLEEKHTQGKIVLLV